MKHLLTIMQEKVFWDINFVLSFLRLHNHTIFAMCLCFIQNLWNSLYKVWGPPGPPFLVTFHLAFQSPCFLQHSRPSDLQANKTLQAPFFLSPCYVIPPRSLGPPILVTFHLANNLYWKIPTDWIIFNYLLGVTPPHTPVATPLCVFVCLNIEFCI